MRASDCYASTQAARDAVKTGSMFNVIHNETLLNVDFITGARRTTGREA